MSAGGRLPHAPVSPLASRRSGRPFFSMRTHAGHVGEDHADQRLASRSRTPEGALLAGQISLAADLTTGRTGRLLRIPARENILPSFVTSGRRVCSRDPQGGIAKRPVTTAYE